MYIAWNAAWARVTLFQLPCCDTSKVSNQHQPYSTSGVKGSAGSGPHSAATQDALLFLCSGMWRQHPSSVTVCKACRQCQHDCGHLTCSNRSRSSSSYRRMSKPGLNPFWELPDAWPSSIGQTYSSPSSCFFFLRFPKLLKVSFFGFKSKQKDNQR